MEERERSGWQDEETNANNNLPTLQEPHVANSHSLGEGERDIGRTVTRQEEEE